MSKDRSGSFSDLEQARAISRRVRGAPSDSTPVREISGFIRFDANRLLSEPVARPTPIADPPAGSVAEGGSLIWDRLLAWCIDALSVHSAFVVDPQGLVVANRGRLGAEQVQGIGARVLIALEHADQMAPGESNSRAIAVEFGNDWLSALRATVGDGTRLTIGVVGSKPLDRDARSAIERAFVSATSGL